MLTRHAPVRVAVMTPDDLSEVLCIERRSHVFPWRAQIFLDCLHIGHVCHVLKDQQQLLAYGIMSIGAKECHILNLCVHQEAQGQGLGTAMLIDLLCTARARAVHTAYLEVRRSNVIAQALYTKTGFNEIGIRRAYYAVAKGREDAIVMAKELGISKRRKPPLESLLDDGKTTA